MYVYSKDGIITVRSKTKLYRPDEKETIVRGDVDRSVEMEVSSRYLEYIKYSEPENQSAIYAAKYLEAKQFLADPTESEEGYLYLVGEAIDAGITTREHALQIVAKQVASAEAERERRRLKREIKLAI